MRFPSIAICTLTVLLAGALTAHASDSVVPGDTAQESLPSEAGLEASNVTSKGTEVTAELNREAATQIIQPEATNSKPEFSSESYASAAKTQAATQQKTEALAKVPQAEVLKADNTLAELSTASANQPIAGESQTQTSSLVEERGKGNVVAKAEALRSEQPAAQSATANTSQLVADAKSTPGGNCIAMANSSSYEVAQGTTRTCPRPQAIPRVDVPELPDEYGASPAMSIYIPVGYGADNNTVFLSGTYQPTVRDTRENDEGSVGTGGIGIGLGDASKSAGVELSYAFETTDESFGEGGFNAKLHRRIGQDASAAIGWNGFLNIGRNDFEQSKYGVVTKVFRTQDSLSKPFSRVAFTVGVGDGQYRSNGAVKAGDNNVNVFGNMAVRVARPVSFIAEWTGTDLGLGLSIAPFRNIPFVITPAVRDVVGAGDAPRFVLGAGTAFRF